MTRTRWLARILSIAVFAFIAAFVFGGNEPLVKPTPREWSLLACFPIGLLVGLAIAWHREVLGGAIGLGSVVMFYVLDFLLSGTFPRGIFFVVLAIPALLFLVLGLVKRRGREQHDLV